VPSSQGVSWRRVDGIIIVDGEHRIASGPEKRSMSLDARDLIIVQAKEAALRSKRHCGVFRAPAR
jgi:hypothetical protein